MYISDSNISTQVAWVNKLNKHLFLNINQIKKLNFVNYIGFKY